MLSQKYDFKKTDNIRVIARFRPSNEFEKREEKKQAIKDTQPKFRSTQEVVLKRPNKTDKNAFKSTLDHIFKMTTPQKKIFDLVGRPMVQAVLEGYNATVFAYGQTGSGKTYTMFGPEKRKTEIDLGLVQRCCTYLFDKLRKLTSGVSSEITEWTVTASFIQIYKEHLSDLLNASARNLRIRTNFQTDTPYVENLSVISVNNIEDILIHLGIAFSNRIVASHKLNSTSSRSHMLLMLSVEQKTRDGAVKRSKLNFGDLAGSEDIRKALGDNPDPERVKEAIAINSSLTALTTAINNLSQGQRPSYRSSGLTHILQDSLGGNSKTTMIVATSPHILNRSETIRTLRFAMTAKKVKNKAKINKELTKAQLLRRIQELEAMNAKLKARVIELETQMQGAGLEVELSTELYGDETGRKWSSIADDDDATRKKNKKKKKKGIVNHTKNAKLSMDDGGVISQASTHQIDVLKKEIDAANDRTKQQQQRNAELEQRTIELSADIDALTQQLQTNRETIEERDKTASLFGKERQMLETRNDEIQREIDLLQSQLNKQTAELDRQIQRQRNNISMKTSENRDLQKLVKDLNLRNEELLRQNNTLTKQMSALKREAYKNNPDFVSSLPMDEETEAMIKELDEYQLNEEERKMKPADLLLHRFAASEANDFRLTSEQRMKKTAKMMTDISDDINDLMGQWLPKRKVRKKRNQSGTLVFQVRQLIGHFNVLVKQMQSTEQSFQNDLKLDIRRRDQEIKKLKEQNKKVHQLQDDLQEKDEVIDQLKKHRDDLRVEKDHLKAQTVEMQDMIFEVQNSVQYLNTELERNRSTITLLKRQSVATLAESQFDIAQILDGEEPPTSSEDELSTSPSADSPRKTRKSIQRKKQKSPKSSKSPKSPKSPKSQKRKKQNKHRQDESEEIMYMSSNDTEFEEDEEEEKLPMGNVQHGPTGTMVIHDGDEDASEDEEDEDDVKNNYKSPRNHEMHRKSKHKKRKSTMSIWREGLEPGDQLDCKDSSGLWWTAKIIGYKGNSDRLQIRYDGWGDKYDEIIGRSSDRLAVYKSMFHSRDNKGMKLIREGYMSKEGKMFKTWRKRYFTLDDSGKLAYYHKKGDENAIGSVDINQMKKTERASFGRTKQFGVQIHTETRKWKFLCQTEQDLTEWIHAINFVKRGQFKEDLR